MHFFSQMAEKAMTPLIVLVRSVALYRHLLVTQSQYKSVDFLLQLIPLFSVEKENYQDELCVVSRFKNGKCIFKVALNLLIHKLP